MKSLVQCFCFGVLVVLSTFTHENNEWEMYINDVKCICLWCFHVIFLQNKKYIFYPIHCCIIIKVVAAAFQKKSLLPKQSSPVLCAVILCFSFSCILSLLFTNVICGLLSFFPHKYITPLFLPLVLNVFFGVLGIELPIKFGDWKNHYFFWFLDFLFLIFDYLILVSTKRTAPSSHGDMIYMGLSEAIPVRFQMCKDRIWPAKCSFTIWVWLKALVFMTRLILHCVICFKDYGYFSELFFILMRRIFH